MYIVCLPLNPSPHPNPNPEVIVDVIELEQLTLRASQFQKEMNAAVFEAQLGLESVFRCMFGFNGLRPYT